MPSPLDAERERIRAKGYTDDEVSRILIARETAPPPQQPVSGTVKSIPWFIGRKQINNGIYKLVKDINAGRYKALEGTPAYEDMMKRLSARIGKFTRHVVKDDTVAEILKNQRLSNALRSGPKPFQTITRFFGWPNGFANDNIPWPLATLLKTIYVTLVVAFAILIYGDYADHFNDVRESKKTANTAVVVRQLTTDEMRKELDDLGPICDKDNYGSICRAAIEQSKADWIQYATPWNGWGAPASGAWPFFKWGWIFLSVVLIGGNLHEWYMKQRVERRYA